jgi:hypothetical protein
MHAALMERSRKGEPFLLCDHRTMVVGQGAWLFLGVNDLPLGDNSGWLEVRIQAGA